MLQPPRSRRSPPPSVTTPPVAATLRDAGPSGLLCRAAEPLPELTRVAIDVELPAAPAAAPDAARTSVALTGVVVGCERTASGDDFEIALRLEGMPPSACGQLVALLEPPPVGR